MTLKKIEVFRPQGAPSVIALDHIAVRRILAVRPSLLMVEKVLAYYPQERRLVGIKNISQNDPFIQGHFPAYPIYPGVLIVESLHQAATILMHLHHHFREGMTQDDVAALLRGFVPPESVLAESRIKHSAPAYPGDQVRLEAQLTGSTGDIYEFRVKALTPSGELASQGRISVALSADALALAEP
jgi:3-hydroxyacyl-[acyl-carrier-protein] dehydratase